MADEPAMVAVVKDRRELILQRLVEVASGVAGIMGSFRNRPSVPEHSRPAFLVNDGDEAAEELPKKAGAQNAKVDIIVMTPDIFLLAGGAESPTTLNMLRCLLVDAIYNDATLLSLTGTNGDIRYVGCNTKDALGRQLEGEMQINFELQYPMKAGETMLVPAPTP